MKGLTLRLHLAVVFCFMFSSVLITNVTAKSTVNLDQQKSSEMVLEPKSSPLKVTLSLSGGYLTGEANEYVYWPGLNNHKASQLIWQIDHLFMVGLGASAEIYDRFSISLNGWFKTFDGSGTMDDYDWLYVGNDWSHWSHHEDTDVVTGNIIDINGGYDVVETDKLSLTGMVGYRRDNFGWESFGGTYIYSIDGFRDASGSFPDVPAISYEQTFHSFYIGLGVEYTSGYFSAEANVAYSPFVFGDAKDTHHMRNLYTDDDFEDGDMVTVGIKGSYLLTNNIAVQLGYTYQWYDTMQGDSKWEFRNEGVTYDFDDGAGMDLYYHLLNLSLLYTF